MVTAKEAFMNKKNLLYSSADLEMRKRLMNFYTYRILLYGCETKSMKRREMHRFDVFRMNLERVKRVCIMKKYKQNDKTEHL